MLSANLENKLLMGAGIAAVIFLLWPRQIAKAAGSAVVGTVVDTGVGAVEGIGTAIGIPVTDQTQCEKDIAAGHTWDASFSCPAGTFLKYVTGNYEASPAP